MSVYEAGHVDIKALASGQCGQIAQQEFGIDIAKHVTETSTATSTTLPSTSSLAGGVQEQPKSDNAALIAGLTIGGVTLLAVGAACLAYKNRDRIRNYINGPVAPAVDGGPAPQVMVVQQDGAVHHRRGWRDIFAGQRQPVPDVGRV